MILNNQLNKKWKLIFVLLLENGFILYTKDTEITKYNEFLLYENSFEGFIDYVNSFFNFLTSERTTKEKISIIISGSTNTVSKNTSSVVHYNNRMKNSIALSCKNYVI